VFAEIFAPFDPKFEDQKADPEQPGDRATLDQPAGIARLDERETRAEDETASQQDHGVDRSDREIGLPRARVESCLIPMAGIDPSQEKGAKEQHLGRQKQPHPGNCRLLLVSCA
jgi:hypothetical protein